MGFTENQWPFAAKQCSVCPRIMKLLLFSLGWLSFVIGLIGAFVPLLPTTPFILMSAWCFNKSSERFHNWLLSLPYLGPPVEEWSKYKVIRLRAKILASLLIVTAVGYVGLFSIVANSIKVIMFIACSGVLLFIWFQKSKISKHKGEIMQFRARHILVENQHEAEDIIRHLGEGKDFAELAAKFSKCPSGSQAGGDLGPFSAGQMVAPFEEAIKALEVGQVSEPVQTQFGYHVIERLDVN